MNYYGITLKKKRGPIKKAQYKTVIDKLQGVSEYYYEDTKGLHVHGVIESRLSLHQLYKLLKGQTKGFRLWLDRVHDINGWRSYIRKDVSKGLNFPHPIKPELLREVFSEEQ